MDARLPWTVADPTRTPAPSAESLSTAQVDDLVEVATDLAQVARPITLAHFRRQLDVYDKHVPGGGTTIDGSGFDPVTVADQAAERAMREVLARVRPRDGIVGEEAGHSPGTSGLTWVLDPIDGTRAYIAGLPTWGVLVALFDGDRPIIGVIDQPWTAERWVGVTTADRRSCDHRRDGRAGPVQARHDVALEDAILCSTFPQVGSDDERRAFRRVRDRARLTHYGTDCTAYALVATGTVDVVVEAGLQPWDVQAVIPVVEGAGGTVTTWDGGPAHGGGRVVASGSGSLHDQVLELLALPKPA